MPSRISFTRRALSSFSLAVLLIISTGRAQQRPSEQKDDVIRINAELVQTDVTVLDKQGRFVEGLRPEQFELLVEGKPQNISFFEEVTAGSRREAALITERNSAGPATEKDNVTTDSTTSTARGRTVFFFVDDMHLSPDSLLRTRRTLQQFVDKVMGGSDQVAVTTASGQLGFLQQLTNNKAVLGLAIERLKPRQYSVTDMQDPPMTEYQAYAVEQNQPDVIELFVEKTCQDTFKIGSRPCTNAAMTNNAVLDEVNTRSDRQGSSSGGSGNTTSGRTGPSAVGNTARMQAERIVRSRARVITRQATQVTLGTLTSLESLVRRAAPLPERKLLIFVSDGFFINFISSSQAYDLRRITDAAMRTGTVVYTVDARGLVSGMTDATKSGLFDTSGRVARINLSEVRASQEPLHNLADETGGRAWLNSNNLDPGIAQAISETSAYYLLAWRPENAAQAKDGFRQVKVNIKGRPDLVVRLSGGFFAEDPEAKANIAPEKALSVNDQLFAAIQASYPKRGIPIVVSVGYLNTEKDGLVLAASAQIEKEIISSPDGGNKADSGLDVMGAVIDDNGKILFSLKQLVTIPTDYKEGSLVTTLQFPKITPGLQQVRIAARDSKSGRVGSVTAWIEIPNLAQGNFSLSSLFLSESVPVSQGTSQKWTIKPDRRFAKTGKLRFQAFVYNADHSTGAPKIHLQMELRREGQMLIQTPASPVPTEGVTDLGRIPVIGEFPLEGFPVGPYELKLTITDSRSKKTASQQVNFTVK
jgi:VWFA-related protein